MATLADYFGRTYDVCAFQGQAPGEVLLGQTLVGDGGRICAGAVKAAQNYVIEFLTEAGSLPYDPGRGCDFMTKLRLGYLRHEADVFAAFALASADVLDRLADREPAAAPADERLTAAELAEVRISPGYCSLKIQLTTAAGPGRAVILPIATA